MEAPDRTRVFARALRGKMTLPEVLLWKALKGRRLDGLHFRRQHPLGSYVLDFYCHAEKHCVEIDGYSHGTGNHPARDERRDAWLSEQGVRTLRISASLVLEEVDDAMATIRQALAS